MDEYKMEVKSRKWGEITHGNYESMGLNQKGEPRGNIN